MPAVLLLVCNMLMCHARRSIIKQSYDAKERIMDASLPCHLAHGNLNGDGFGIGAPPDAICCRELVRT